MDISQIQTRIDLIEKYENEIKASREMINNDLENNPTYLEAVDGAKEAISKKRILKENILNSAENQKLLAGIKENEEEISTMKEILSAELMQLYQENKTDEIQDASGQQRKFKVIARLLPKRYASKKKKVFESDKPFS